MKSQKELRESIMLGIRREENRRARVLIATSALAVLFSISGIAYLARYVALGLHQSGFYDYLSLVFSDTDIVFSNIQTFALSLIESFPFFTVTAFLAVCAVFLASVRIFAVSQHRFRLSFRAY